MRYSKVYLAIAVLFAVAVFSSCRKPKSVTTGWEYNNPKNGGFEVTDFTEQMTGPGLIMIEGGTYMMGSTYDDYMYEWHNNPRRVTVRTFYLDQTEVANVDYLEYLYWLSRVFGADYPEVYKKALPDTLVWRDRLAYNEPLVELYLRHPAYKDYPVVGVSWVQATDFCAWRTDRVNEQILVQRGVLEMTPDQLNENNFNTEAYLVGQYEGVVNKNLADLNPSGTGERRVRLEDGIILPKYRLPTEAEWEFAALGLIGNTYFENVADRKQYPWTGHYLRSEEQDFYGLFNDNYKRGRGDYMGVSGWLNDGAVGPAPVGSFFPNDFGLYNMAGNVSEWVMDVYRPLSIEDVTDLNPYRGNVFQEKVLEADGMIAEKDSLGRIKYQNVPVTSLVEKRNYRQSDNINYLDGDFKSTIGQNDWLAEGTSGVMYDYSATSMINDKARVYKGGSWKDLSYWMNPGTRRFLDQNQSTDYIGFRCAMDRVGGQTAAEYLGSK